MNVSDTAIWAAVQRADETDRQNPLFRDPFARSLAGERGARIAADMRAYEKHAWTWVVRTYLFDQFIEERIRLGAELVVNLAAGLDTRPYRMQLPADLRWVEVDLPDLMAYKENALRDVRPGCRLERVRLDLSNVDSRRKLFAGLGAASKHALVITEGLLIYLSPEQVTELGKDLAAAGFEHWVFDIVSPGLLRTLQKAGDTHLPLQFAPAEGSAFFTQADWHPMTVASTAETAAKLGRGPLFLQLMALFPENDRPDSRTWAGVCLARRLNTS